MDVLAIGNSSIFQRRVLPALLASPSVARIHLASRRAGASMLIPNGRQGYVFKGYQTALDSLDPCIAYISLPNQLHGIWARAALEAGFHVIVDKPALLNLDEAMRLTELADNRKLCLAEATVWPFHPQIETVNRFFADTPKGIQCVQSVFTFPTLVPSNFRNDRKMGGGSFNDLCAYAISPGRIFFGTTPDEVWCRVLSHDQSSGIDTSFSFTAVYSEGRVQQGYFGFGAEYRNTMSLLGCGVSVVVDPAFTSQSGFENKIQVRRQNIAEVLTVAPGDVFGLFFEKIIDSIQGGDWSEWPAALLQDAVVADRAAQSAGIRRYVD
jgi:NDP-hexose-3-ketoreductase